MTGVTSSSWVAARIALALESDALDCPETVPLDDLHVGIESEAGSIRNGHASVARTNCVVIRAGLQVSKEQFERPVARKSSRQMQRSEQACAEIEAMRHIVDRF